MPDKLPPKMYLAQIEGRCSLHYAAEGADRQQWLKEWCDPQETGKAYTREVPKKDNSRQKDKKADKNSYWQFEVKFSGRLISNSGRDSIVRPVLGVNGIPYIPGSSIKGLFRRACTPEQANKYCGTADRPGILRFHGGYPVGNWTQKKMPQQSQSQPPVTPRYGIEDIVHPQQDRQVKNQKSTSAYVLISLLEPKIVFEFSSRDPQISWNEVETIFQTALRQGVGGKTSTGYGFSLDYLPEYADNLALPEGSSAYERALHLKLDGTGVSSKILNGEPEFRQNMFKAALRGHLTRLFGGVCSDSGRVDTAVNSFFGSTGNPGEFQIFWQPTKKIPNNPVYNTQGVLHLLPPEGCRDLVEMLWQFAYIMGGFGKTWRRVAHNKFYPDYLQQKGIDIGCHWEMPEVPVLHGNKIDNTQALTEFLNRLYNTCQEHLNISSPQRMPGWREAWHPANVVVYSQKIDRTDIAKNSAIELFHKPTFKNTPAIEGRNGGDRPTHVSSVWHRLLPLGNDKYLEVITIFYGSNREEWKDNLNRFIGNFEGKGKWKITWGNPIA